MSLPPFAPDHPEDWIKRYLAGESENRLARESGRSRIAFRSFLLRHGVEPRSYTEANRLLATARTPEQRRSYASAAQAARRGQQDSMSTREARARSNEITGHRIGRWEKELTDELIGRGLPVRPQQAVGPYNLDLGIRPVAVEVHSESTMPHRITRHRERLEYLINREWLVVYVLAAGGSLSLSLVANQIVALCELAQGMPPGQSQYWVIRRTGELSTLSLDGDHLS